MEQFWPFDGLHSRFSEWLSLGHFSGIDLLPMFLGDNAMADNEVGDIAVVFRLCRQIFNE